MLALILFAPSVLLVLMACVGAYNTSRKQSEARETERLWSEWMQGFWEREHSQHVVMFGPHLLAASIERVKQ